MEQTYNPEIIALPAIETGVVNELPMVVGGEDLFAAPVMRTEVELAEVIPLHPIQPVEFKQPNVGNAEILDWLAPIVGHAYQEAETVMESNRQSLRDGNYDAVPLDVDALGTARKIIAVREQYGAGSPEYAVSFQGLVMDCDRKLDEAESKNVERYFAPITYTYDPESDTVYADGHSYDDMAISGLSPIGDPEEAARRPHDFVKSVVNKELIKRPESAGLAVVQVSLCPDYAINSYKHNPKGAHSGYAPEVEKLMVSFDTFNPATNEMYHEQVALPGKYITPALVTKAYEILGLVQKGADLSKTDLYGIQGTLQREDVGDAMAFVRILDTLASQRTGRNIFMGQEVAADHPKDYEQVKQDAHRECEARLHRTMQLVAYTLELEEQNTDHAAGTVMQNKFIKDLLLDEAQSSPEIALKAFDKETALGFQKARSLQAQGKYHEAQMVIDETRVNAPDASGCGAGSCGLESLDSASLEDQLGKALLKAKSGETLLKDGVRKCGCGGTVYYAYTKDTYKKTCTSCKALEVDGKLVRAGRPKQKV
jgi:hypothetical protein